MMKPGLNEAQNTWRRRGEATTAELWAFIKKFPGHNMYWYSKKLEWSTGRTERAVKRLREAGKIKETIYQVSPVKLARAIYPVEGGE